jgi:hypothetical protein
MIESFTKIVTPTRFISNRKTSGPHSFQTFPVFVTITYAFDTGKSACGTLSITGVEGPRKNGDCAGSCGQITLAPENAAFGWSEIDVRRLAYVWRRWHLNNMRAGSPAQEEFLRSQRHLWSSNAATGRWFDWARDVLREAGLEPDPFFRDYSFGTEWVKERVPEEVLAWLMNLPAAEQEHPWSNL